MTLNNGLDIWKELVGRGLEETRANGLPGYDVELVSTLKKRLYPVSTRSFSSELQSNPPSTEVFFDAFFSALKPFSKMLSDVLCMFESAGARRSDENLRIAFDFDKAESELALTLQQFREVETFFRRISRPIIVRLWDSNSLWSLREDVHNILKSFDVSSAYNNRNRVRDPHVAQWIEENGRPAWLAFPGFPRSGNPELDKKLGMAENLIDYMITEVLKIGTTYREFERRLGELPWEDQDWALEDNGGNKEERPRRDFVRAAHDFWPNSFAELVCLGIEAVNDYKDEEKATAAAQLASAIQSGFNRPTRHERTVESIEQDFRDLINLPIWKKRHELYAVWVASRISDALKDLSWAWHPDGDTLRFPFGGIELATLRSGDGNTHIFWTEKRTALEDGGMFGRKHIQPDYRIMTVPTYRKEATSLVVECKQYRKWSRKNFGAALDDYAKGCPNAVVILANYGPADTDILNLVDPLRRNRTFLVGNFKPGEESALNSFRALVRNAYTVPPIPRITEGVNVELRWGPMFQDLDLHLFIQPIDANEARHVGYGAGSGSLTEPPWVEWPEDIRTSPPGIERITISRWLNADYDILVHDYSGNSQFPQGDVSVRMVQNSGIEKQVFAPRGGFGRWWYVCRIHGDTGRVEEINSIHSECPCSI
jgi:hypothetical protein